MKARNALKRLEEPYRSRAVPPGTPHYWSWMFADPVAREPLLGVYALAAEWRALTDASMESSVARIKLAWWRDEIQRLSAGSPVHPITRYIDSMPGASNVDLAQLQQTIMAAATELSGVPLARSTELECHADALYGIPLRVAAALSSHHGKSAALHKSTAALAAAVYLVRAISDYEREARFGRVPFAVDELLAQGIGNEDLAAAVPPPRLQKYLRYLQETAIEYFSVAAGALAPDERRDLRHIAVLAALGRRNLLERKSATRADFRFADLYNAWNAARRAAAAR